MKTLSIGVVGAGDIARKVHLPVLLAMPSVRVLWVYDANVAQGRSVAKAFRVPAVNLCSPADLPACDVALLAIPVGARAPYYDAFAEQGVAVLAEKPFAVSAANHRALTDRFEPHRLGCGYMRRFYSSTRILRDLVQSMRFGRLKRMSIAEGNRSAGSRVDRSYIDDACQSYYGGILSELGCHSLDVALFITGARQCEIQSCDLVVDGHVDRKITARINLTGSTLLPPEGTSLEFCVSWLDRQANRIVLEFEHCEVWAEIQPGSEVRMGRLDRPLSAIVLTAASRAATTANQAFYLQWRSFFDGVYTGKESEVSAHSALPATSLIERLYEAGRAYA